jgi:hypothetical protein
MTERKIAEAAILVNNVISPITRRSIAVAVCAFMLGCVSSSEDPDSASKQQDLAEPVATAVGPADPVIRSSVRRNADTVEVELRSDRPFEFGAMPAVLVIGDMAFGRSHFAADGNLRTIVFVLEAKDYDALSSDAPVSFGYLDSGAAFDSSAIGARGAGMPKIRPDQVKGQRLQLGKLRRGQMGQMEIAQ